MEILYSGFIGKNFREKSLLIFWEIYGKFLIDYVRQTGDSETQETKCVFNKKDSMVREVFLYSNTYITQLYTNGIQNIPAVLVYI